MRKTKFINGIRQGNKDGYVASYMLALNTDDKCEEEVSFIIDHVLLEKNKFDIYFHMRCHEKHTTDIKLHTVNIDDLIALGELAKQIKDEVSESEE